MLLLPHPLLEGKTTGRLGKDSLFCEGGNYLASFPQAPQVVSFSDNKSDDSEKDKLEGLPPHAKNIYENAKYDIISNILHNF